MALENLIVTNHHIIFNAQIENTVIFLAKEIISYGKVFAMQMEQGPRESSPAFHSIQNLKALDKWTRL